MMKKCFELWMESTEKEPMEIIPAIDLLDGQCVRLHQGNYEEVTHFNEDPIKQALTWQEQGAKLLHLVDLDGAKTGNPVNDVVVKKIITTLQIPVQLGGGVRSIERAEELLSYGLGRVILGTIAIEKPDLVEKLASRHPGRIVVGIDAKQGKVATHGWIEESNIKATDLARSLNSIGIAAIISTDIATDGAMSGPNIQALKEMVSTSTVPVIASGGVSCIADLIALNDLTPLGLKGVIIGRALYDRAIDLQEAIKVISNSHLQDHQFPENFIA